MIEPTVSIVLPVLDGLEFLRRSLPPLLAEVPDRALEVLVVDDGCSDGSADFATALGAQVIATTGRLGPAAARNLGARHVRGEVLFFVDADVVVHRDCITRVRAALRDPEVVAVFGSYDDRPPDPGFFSRWKNLQHHHVHTRSPGEASTFWSGCGAVRAEAFAAVGGFDVARFPLPSIEDIELGYRLRARGGRILLDPSIRATHLKRWGLVDLIRTDILRRALPWARLLQSRPEARDDLNVRSGERLRAGLAGLVVASLPLPPLSLLTLGAAFLANAQLLGLFLRRHGMLFALEGGLFLQVYYLYATGAWLWAAGERLSESPAPKDRATSRPL